MKNTEHTLHQIRTRNPLVHNITNYVVMNNTANALLAVGASPVMAHAIEEVKDIVSISSALVINMGTLSGPWIDSMELAAKTSKTTKTPFVFDPVGVGASTYRTETAQKIIEAAIPDVIRGNASEIMALARSAHTTKGVDSTMRTEDAVEKAVALSKMLNNTIVISGETDYIVTGDDINKVTNGSPLMAKVTGMGCTATAMVGACMAVEANTHIAATAAMTIMGIAGDIAKDIAKGPGSFQMHFLDSLYQLSEETISEKARINDDD